MHKARHLSAAEREQERKRKRKIRRTVLTILIAVLIAGIIAEVIILKNIASVDRLFLRAVERGVAAGWQEGKADLQLKEQGRVTDTSFLQLELENVETFRNKAYNDKELGNLAKKYIAALRKCMTVAETYDPADDSSEFWSHFSAPYTERLIVLRKLYTGEYALNGTWDDFPEVRDEVLLKGWVAETAGALKFEVAEEDGAKKFTARFRNDSGVDIEYFNVDVNLYNKDDKLAATAEIIREDIKDGQEVQLVFYYSGKKLSAYRISAVDCIAAEQPEEEQEEE